MRFHTLCKPVLLISILACTPAYATLGNYANMFPCPKIPILQDGFYLGAQIGYDSFRVRNTFSSAAAGTTFSPGISFSNNMIMSENGLAGGIFAGFGMYFNRLYLGGELFMNESAANQSQGFNAVASAAGIGTASATGYIKISTGPSWGISVLPGLKVNDTSLLYIRFGYNQAQLRGQSFFAASAPFAGGVVSFATNAIETQWTGGFNYGLGIETAVYSNISIRSEYSHTGYNSFADSNDINYAASDNQLMVSLIYHFT